MKHFIIIDTETTRSKSGQLVYDLGWLVCEADGTIAERRSFVVEETFNNKGLMRTAYYAEKIPMYREGLGSEWLLASLFDIWQVFLKDIEAYHVSSVWAFNARFDLSALNATIKAYSNGFVPCFFPENVTAKDIWSYAGSTVCNTKKYVKWCIANDKLTPSGNPKTSAEVVYQYLMNDASFVENHTALSDCYCELLILQRAKRRKQKARHSMGQGWKEASMIMKGMKE